MATWEIVCSLMCRHVVVGLGAHAVLGYRPGGFVVRNIRDVVCCASIHPSIYWFLANLYE